MSNDVPPRLPINYENLDRLTVALGKMADAAGVAARQAEAGFRRIAEIMDRHTSAT